MGKLYLQIIGSHVMQDFEHHYDDISFPSALERHEIESSESIIIMKMLNSPYFRGDMSLDTFKVRNIFNFRWIPEGAEVFNFASY